MRILDRPEYLGHVVNFRTRRDSYKDNFPTPNAKEDWKIFENRHETIIEQSVFDTMQKLRGTPRRQDKSAPPNPLTGLLFCHDCKAKMYNSRRWKNTIGATKDSYDCSTYTLGKNKFVEQCSGHFIRTDVVRELVLDSIRNICGYVRESQAEFIEKIREESVLHRGETAKSHKKIIAKNERQC
ncbi:MAG: recombinase family protein [Oscillospiraceae bacterium]|nr:recombinase family protein [Oscillospiraceae bacterium]